MNKPPKTRKLSKRQARRERPAGDMLPYARHIDDVTLATRDGQQIQVLHLQGFAFETADTQELNYRFVAKAIADLAVKQRLPSSGFSEYAQAGGLMAYGSDGPELFRRTATFVDKILRGEKPADIPVEQPTKFNLVINLKAAKAIGVTVPPTLIARAEEVIE